MFSPDWGNQDKAMWWEKEFQAPLDYHSFDSVDLVTHCMHGIVSASVKMSLSLSLSSRMVGGRETRQLLLVVSGVKEIKRRWLR